MASLIRLDTHVVVWLYTGEAERFSPRARALLESGRLVVSPIVQLELSYLHEIQRLAVGGADIVADLASRIGLALSDQSLASVVQASASLAWTGDPFDRLIVGDALRASCLLLTRDDHIRANTSIATW